MTDIFGIVWEAELAYRRERITKDFRQATGGRGMRLRPWKWSREHRPAFPPTHVRQADGGSPAAARGAAVGGGGGHVRR